ncbi:MAG: hypothetical protein RLZZ312_1002 [Bacteroidota bacterium]|jgi:hypothetical protein
MKISSFCLLIGVCFGAWAQTSYILTKSGKKFEMQYSSIQIAVLDKLVNFKTLSGSAKEVAFSDLDVAKFGNFMFKSFKFVENKNNNCFFVLAESAQKTLISIGIPAAESDEDVSLVPTKYEVYVLDSNYKVIDFLFFNNQKSEKGAIGRSELQDFIRRNFEDCSDVIDRFGDFEKLNSPQYMGIIGFFSKPIYVNCNN